MSEINTDSKPTNEEGKKPSEHRNNGEKQDEDAEPPGGIEASNNPDQISSNSEDQLQNTDKGKPADSSEKDNKVNPERNTSSNETSSVTVDATRETSKPEAEQDQILSNSEDRLQNTDNEKPADSSEKDDKVNPERSISSNETSSVTVDATRETSKPEAEQIQNGEQQLGPQVQKSGTKVEEHDKETDEKVGKDTLNPIEELDHSSLRDTSNGGEKENPTCQMVYDIATESIDAITDVTIEIFKEMIDLQRHSLLSMKKEIQLVINEIKKEPGLKIKYSDPDPDQEKSNVISEGQIEPQIIKRYLNHLGLYLISMYSNGANDNEPLQYDKLSGNNTTVMSELPSSSPSEELKVDCQDDETHTAESKESDIKVKKNGDQEHCNLANVSNDKKGIESLEPQNEHKVSCQDIQTEIVIDDVKEMRLTVYKEIQVLGHDAENKVIISVCAPMLKMQEPQGFGESLYEKEGKAVLKGDQVTNGQSDASNTDVIATTSEQQNSSHTEEEEEDGQNDEIKSTTNEESKLSIILIPNGDQEHCISVESDNKKANESPKHQNESEMSFEDDLIKSETVTKVVSERGFLYNEVEVKGHGTENQENGLMRVPMLNIVQVHHSLGKTLYETGEETSANQRVQETIVQNDPSKVDTTSEISAEQIQSGAVNEAIELSSIETIEEEKSVKESNDANEDLNEAGSIPENVTSKEPLHFHSIHGASIQLSDSGFRAQRKNSSKFFGQGITFSSRPIAVKEKIYIQIEEISDLWVGCLTFGFTNYDPNTLAGQLPGIIITDLEKKPGYWAGHLAKTFCRKNDIFHYYTNSTGTISYGINGIDKGTLFWSVDTTKPLWAMIDIFGYFTKVRLIDCRTPIHTINIRTPISNLPIPRLRYQNSIQLIPLKPHTTTGKNVKILDFKGVAARSECLTNQGYVFTNSPMRPGQTIVIQILCTGPGYEFLPLGLTCCDPSILNPSDLPDSAEALVEWGQNWVVFKNVANFVRAGDELAVTRTVDGDIRVRKNNGEPITLMRVDRKLRFWTFLEMYGTIRMIRMWTTISRNDHIFALRKSLSSQTI